MPLSIPKPQLILGYRDLFGVNPPKDRISLLRGMCRNAIMAELSRLNYSLKPKLSMHADISFEAQNQELLYMCGSNQILLGKYAKLLAPFRATKSDYPILFTRQACVFAMEEVIQSDLTIIEGFGMANSWESLLLYYLAVNSFITRYSPEEEGGTEESTSSGTQVQLKIPNEKKEMVRAEDLPPFEELNRKTIILNELAISTDPIYLAYRGYSLLDYISKLPTLGQEVENYLSDLYGLSYSHFVYQLMRLHFANNKDGQNNMVVEGTGRKIDLSMLYRPDGSSRKMFRTLSQKYPSEHPIRLVSVRKFPFYCIGALYLIIDLVFLLDKAYGQFINDFWFDRVRYLTDDKGQVLFPIRRYRGIIGEFLEDYLTKILDFAFAGSKHFHVYKFGQLNYFLNGKNMQFLDIYIRNSDDLFLAEVKSTGIYDNEKYAGDIDGFYHNDREGFFNSFGIAQMITALERLDKEALRFDPGFPRKGRIKVYPALIVNEKALQTPAMAKVFNDYFSGLLSDAIDPRLKIQPLSIIHLTDWENMEDFLHNDPTPFFRIMKYHVRNPLFIPPFYNTLAIKDAKRVPHKPYALLAEVMAKYGDQVENSS